MERVIITGADGFIGSHIVDFFLKNKVEVLAIGRKEIPTRLVLQSGLKYLQADAFKPEEYLEKIEYGVYDTFFHFAWGGVSGEGRNDYVLQMLNAEKTVVSLRAAARLGCKRFVGAGSITEKEIVYTTFGQGLKGSEADSYKMGKLMAHMMCKKVAEEEGIELLWTIITNVFGEGESSPRFINNTIRKFLKNEPLIFTPATQNYDFIHIDDAVRAFYLIGLKGKHLYEYVVGSGNAKPLKEYIFEMQEELGKEKDLLFGHAPFVGVNLPIEEFSISQTFQDTGFLPEISFIEGIRRTAEWIRAVDYN